MIKKSDNTIKNFQKSTIQIQKCRDCTRTECQLLYDRHHDQHFSYHCGTVVYQSQDYLLEYRAQPYYWEKEYAKRRENKRIKKEKDHILKKLEKWKQNYKITENSIKLPDATLHDEKKLINLCKNTFFKVHKTNIKHDNEIIDIKYQIKLRDHKERQKIIQKEKKEKEEQETDDKRNSKNTRQPKHKISGNNTRRMLLQRYNPKRK